MELVSKSEYAQMRGRKPSAVSNWIADGKLEAPALTGDGMINVLLADAMLAERLDPSQQLAQTRPLAGVEDLADDEDADLLNDATDGATSTTDATRRYLASKAEEKELDVERKKRAMMADSGRWMETAEAERAFARKLTAIFTDLEAWVTQAAGEIAAELGTDERATTLKLRESMRTFRERQAKREEDAATAANETNNAAA